MVNYGDALPPPTEEMALALIGAYSIACALAGFLVDTFFFGIFTVQLVTYWTGEIKDPRWVRALVCAVSIAACFLTGFNWWQVSHQFVYNFGNHTVFFEIHASSWLSFIDCITMSLCQTFFSYRAYRLCSRNLAIPLAVGVCITGSLASTLAVAIMYLRLNSLLDSHIIQPGTLTWLILTLIADGINTGCILYGLITLGSKAGMEQTNRLITRLIRMTLESQAAATVLAIAMLVDVIVDPTNMFGVTILTFHSKVYVIGFFYSLNSRKSSIMPSMFTIHDTNHPMAFSHTQAATIVVDQETEMHVMHVPPPPRGITRTRAKASPKLEIATDDEGDGDTKSLGSSGIALSGNNSSTTKVSHMV